jgi:HK97 family phage portal protein
MFDWLNRKSAFSVLDLSGPTVLNNINDIYYDYYEKDPVVNAALNLIANTATSININGLNFVIDLRLIIFELFLTGNCFLFINNSEINILESKFISIVLKNNVIVAYKCKKSTREFKKDEILHLKFIDPKKPYFGMSPLKALHTTIESHLSLLNYLHKFLKNGARPSGIICYKDYVTPTKEREIKHEMLRIHESIGREGAVAVFGGGDFHWQQLGMSPKEMELLAILEALQVRIASNLGVPSILIDIRDAKFSNYKEAKEHFYDVVVTHVKYIINQLSQFLKIDIVIDQKTEVKR